MFKEFMKKVNKSDLILMLLAVAAAAVLVSMMSPADGVSLATVLVTGVAGGKHAVDGPLTTTVTEEGAPGLLRNEIDSRVVRIRPMSTPIDQISRCGGCRPCGSMKVEYYSVDTKPSAIEVNKPTAGTLGSQAVLKFQSAECNQIAESETVLFPSMKDDAGKPLVGYVASKAEDGTLTVIPVGVESANVASMVSKFSAKSQMVRMGRAATELDVQTAQFEAIPKKDSNLCQIFKAQVEQSTFQKIANKEVGWSFSDQEEVAIIDMRLGMEKSFLFGSMARFNHPLKNEEIMLTGGIWNQAGNEWSYAADEPLAAKDLVSMMKSAFSQNCGSSRKILVAGSDLIERLNTLEYTKTISATDKVTHWGIDFSELHSKFGTLYVVHSEVFDTCGHSQDGLIIDPEYLTKYSHVPFRTESLDLKKSGVRNTEAVVITEASCLVLRYPRAHTRIVAG